MSVYRTVSEMFSVKNEISHSRSLKMAQLIDHIRLSIGRPTAIVPFLSYLTLNNIVTLKSVLEVTQDHSNWYRSKAWVRFPIRLP